MGERKPTAPADDRRQLVQRVVASSYFSKSARLSELFLYLCDRVLKDSASDIHELEVGREVFGRPAHYDTTADNIVRVHASMLRKRVDQYFTAEGANEPIVIDIPKGNYAPVFRPRIQSCSEQQALPDANASGNSVHSLATQPGAARSFSWIGLFTLVLAIIFACSTAYLLLRDHARPHSATAIPGNQADVRQFWSQMFSAGKPTEVVLDDAAVALYQEVTGRRITLSEYFDRSYRDQLTPSSPDAAALDRALTSSLLLRRQSSYEDVALVPKLARIGSQQQSSIEVRFARDFSFRDVKAANTVLLGNSESNPWIQAFQTHLTLNWKYDQATDAYYPVDTADRNPDKYGTASDSVRPHDSYASVAFLPNLGGTGNVLIISATGGTAMSAALDYLSNEQSLEQLRSRLKPARGSNFGYFEILLRVESHNSLRRLTTLVLCRQPQV